MHIENTTKPIGFIGYELNPEAMISKVDATLQWTPTSVTGEWSVRDIIAHVTWWEEEALKHLPHIREGGRPPRYSVKYGGIDSFNALMTEKRKGLSLEEVLSRHEDVHGRLVTYVKLAPAELYAKETRFRRRLRLDTYGHYPVHAKAIRAWRRRTGSGR